MEVDLKGRDILSIHDLSREELHHILDRAEFIKKGYLSGEKLNPWRAKRWE